MTCLLGTVKEFFIRTFFHTENNFLFCLGSPLSRLMLSDSIIAVIETYLMMERAWLSFTWVLELQG